MGTSLTLEFWQRLAVLLVAAMGVMFVLTAACDALAVRLLRRRRRGPSRPGPSRPTTAGHRPAARC